MSRAEEITNEVRKIVLTCRSLEAQLQQSIPKKVHQEEMAKMQANIDSLSRDLARARGELEKATSHGVTLESQVASQNETISSQSKTIESLTAKLSESTSLYSQTFSRAQELESKISSMVDSKAFDSVQKRCVELEQQVSDMVPRDQYSDLEMEHANSVQKYEDLRKTLEQMVPRERLNVAESRNGELERELADSVPKADFEELAGKIAQITKEAIELANKASAAMGMEMPISVEATSSALNQRDAPTTVLEFAEPTAPTTAPPEAPTTTVEVTPANQTDVTQPSPDPLPVEPAATLDPIQSEVQSQAHEIAEVQSQLSEINTTIETGVNSIPQVAPPTTVETEKGFRFSNTEFCARSGMEFLEDIEKVDLSVLAAHCQTGDFERWFKDVLSDESSAQSLQKIRESNASGEELRSMMVAAIAPRYRA